MPDYENMTYEDILQECNDPDIVLERLQSYPLKQKIWLSKHRIQKWYEHYEGEVYVAYSGGKDSTVLLHLVRSLYPKVEGVFCDTGLEYPEIKEFVRSQENITWIKPQKSYREVVNEHGWPVISKHVSRCIDNVRNTNSKYTHNLRLMNNINGAGLPLKYLYLTEAPFQISDKCCDVMKKRPFRRYEKSTGKKPYIGVMAADSLKRKQSWHEHRCNNFDSKHPQSRPLMFWKDTDIWEYIEKKELPICSVYEQNNLEHTGCMWCLFGLQFDNEPNRFQQMKKTHPKIWDYCINRMGMKEVLDFIGAEYK